MRYWKVLAPIVLAAACLHTPGIVDLKPRTKDFTELFSGERAISLGLKHFGYSGLSVDERYNPHYDLLKPEGFLLAVRHILEQKQGSLLWMAPPCGSWVWMSASSTGRTAQDPCGKDVPSTRINNMLADRICYLMLLAFALGIFVIIEQPWSSVLWEKPIVKEVFEFIKVLEARHDLGTNNAKSQKSLILKGTFPGIANLNKSVDGRDKKRMKLEKRPGEELTVTSVDLDGNKRVTGSKGLKDSQAYPLSFGAEVALQYHEYIQTNGHTPAAPPWTLEELNHVCDLDIDLGGPECFADFEGWANA